MNAIDINNEYYNKVIKDKMKYENQLHKFMIRKCKKKKQQKN